MKKLVRKIRYWLGKPVKWQKCTKASCWNGEKHRMMNILSPHFSDGKFKEYMAWMKARGCNTAHLILINKADGEGGGYNCALNADHARLAKKRIKKLYLEGFAIVPWIITDDTSEWAKDLFNHTEERVKALADAGLFQHASYVVLGLEMNEGGSFPNGDKGWPKVAAAVRKHYTGKLGTHHTSGNAFRYASLGDIVCGQLEPEGATTKTIPAQINAIRALGKEPVGFEYSRSADRNKAQIALNAGAIGVGNW